MPNTAKRDEKRAEKALFKRLLNYQEMVQSMKYEIVKLQEELNNYKLNKEEAKTRASWQYYMISRSLIDLEI